MPKLYLTSHDAIFGPTASANRAFLWQQIDQNTPSRSIKPKFARCTVELWLSVFTLELSTGS